MSIKFNTVALVFCCGLVAAGCRSHQKTPLTASAAPKALEQTPAIRVEAPTRDFVKAPAADDDIGSDPIRATTTAEQKGWLRDAFFAFDSSLLSNDAQHNLTSSANWLRTHDRKFHVMVEGHCDERGTESYNLALGDHRAWEAKEYLSALGIDPKIISTISYGKERPFAPGHDESAWAQNRRAHLVLTAAN